MCILLLYITCIEGVNIEFLREGTKGCNFSNYSFTTSDMISNANSSAVKHCLRQLVELGMAKCSPQIPITEMVHTAPGQRVVFQLCLAGWQTPALRPSW